MFLLYIIYLLITLTRKIIKEENELYRKIFNDYIENIKNIIF